MARKLEIEIVGNERDALRSIGRVGGASEGLGKLFLKSGVVGAGFEAGRQGLRALGSAAQAGWAEFSEGQKVAAQTKAVIESTGGVANVTAKHVDELAQAELRKTGIDDEAIKSGENMLLTFRGIRNEAGAGNDVFDQATAAALDMSVAMGTDATKAALTLGKALNDPAAGLTKLTKQGVTFTEAQKEQIKALEESGHTMAAQKIILAELDKEFGGSAETVGKTLPGQLNVLKESLSNVAGDLVGKATPALTGFVQGFADALPEIESFIGNISNRVGPVVAGIAQDIVGAWPQVKTTISDAFSIFETYVVPVIVGVKDVVVDTFRAIGGVLSSHREELATLGRNVGTIFQGIATVVVPILRVVFTEVLPVALGVAITAISGLSTAVVTAGRIIGDALGVIRTAFTTTKTWVSDRIGDITGFVTGLPSNVSAVAGRLENVLLSPIRTGVAGVKTYVGDRVDEIVDFWTGLPGRAERAFTAGWSGIVAGLHAPFTALSDWVGGDKGPIAGVIGFFKGLPGGIASALASGAKAAADRIHDTMLSIFDVLPGFVRKALGIHSPSSVFAEIGEHIIEGAIVGMKSRAGDLVDAAWAEFRKLPGAVVGAVSGIGIGSDTWPFVELGKKMAAAVGWTGAQWEALKALWTGESGWNPEAVNASSGAGGIPQALPSSKMGMAAVPKSQGGGGDAGAQIAWGLNYIAGRYGDPATAYAMWLSRSPHWYAEGGIFGRPSIIGVGEAGPEAVVPIDQWVNMVVPAGGAATARSLAPLFEAAKIAIVGKMEALRLELVGSASAIVARLDTVIDVLGKILDAVGGLASAASTAGTAAAAAGRAANLPAGATADKTAVIPVPKPATYGQPAAGGFGPLPKGAVVDRDNYPIRLGRITGLGPVPMAEGAIIKGGRGGVLSLIGEGRHNELVTPLPSGGLGGGGPTVNLTVQGSIYGGGKKQVAEELARDIHIALLDRQRSGPLGFTS
jgi:hypothetical protein